MCLVLSSAYYVLGREASFTGRFLELRLANGTRDERLNHNTIAAPDCWAAGNALGHIRPSGKEGPLGGVHAQNLGSHASFSRAPWRRRDLRDARRITRNCLRLSRLLRPVLHGREPEMTGNRFARR